MPTKVTAYACSHGCRRNVLTSKSRMEFHEARCFKNPARKACQTCDNYHVSHETVYNRDHGGDPGSSDYEVKGRYCGVDVPVEEMLMADCEKWIPRKEGYKEIEP